MSTDDGSGELPTDERSALAWIMSGAAGVVVAGGIAKRLLDRRRERALEDAEAAEDAATREALDEAEGHPS